MSERRTGQKSIAKLLEVNVGAGLGVVPGTNAEEQVNLPSGAQAGSELFVGVTRHAGTAGQSASIIYEGFVDVVVNASSTNIAPGAKLTLVATTGRFAATTTDGAYYCGIAQEAATADGVTISMLIQPGFRGA